MHEDIKTAKHHIVPRSMGMNDDYETQPWNIIALTETEHLIAHLLLSKIYPDVMTGAYRLMVKARKHKLSGLPNKKRPRKVKKKSNVVNVVEDVLIDLKDLKNFNISAYI